MSPLVPFPPVAAVFLSFLIGALLLYAIVELRALFRWIRNERRLREARTDLRIARGYRSAHRRGYLPEDMQ